MNEMNEASKQVKALEVCVAIKNTHHPLSASLSTVPSVRSSDRQPDIASFQKKQNIRWESLRLADYQTLLNSMVGSGQ